MENTVKKGRVAAFLIITLALSAFLIDRLFLTGNRLLHLTGTVGILLFFSLVMIALLKISHEKKMTSASDDRDEDQSVPGVLIPVEDESDLGELIEVDGDVPAYTPFENPEREPSRHYRISEPVTSDTEALEELEAFDEPVEELEAVEE